MKQLDILFVHANDSETIYQELHKQFSAKEPPQWAGLLANHVRIRGFSTAIIDAECDGITIEETVKKIVDINAKIVCFIAEGQNPNSSTQSMEGAVKTAEKLKQIKPTSKILFGGQHVNALPDEVLNKHSFIDFVLQNEGVYCISDLCAIEDLDDEFLLGKVKGLGFKDREGNINLNEINQLVPSDKLHIDLPGIAWDLLPPVSKYRTSYWHSWSNNTENSPFASIYSTFGCKYKCHFCMINIINRTEKGNNISSANSNVYREYDPSFIIEQLEKFSKWGVKNIKWVDELFVYNPKHFLKICDLIIERGYNFNSWCYSRIDSCKPEYLDKLKRAGFNWLALGVENPQQTLRKEIHKGGFKDIKINHLFEITRSAGINIGANYIVGLPMDTHESVKYTTDFMMENLTENMNIYPAQCLPGSPLYLEAKRKGWKLPNSYAGYSMHSYYTENSPTDNLTAAEILKYRDDIWHLYFTNEKYLTMMENKFGKVCSDNIRMSTKIKLNRKILGD